MTQRDDFNSKNVRLISKEAGLAATCLEQGLTALRKANFAQKWNYYQAFFLLSIGVERLLKLTIITWYRVEENKLPTNGELKSYGHNIENMYFKLLEKIDPNNKFIEKDSLYISILQFLTEYAKTSRYHNLDRLSGVESSIDPIHQWHVIQKEILSRHANIKPISNGEKYIINQMSSFASVMHTDEADEPINDLLYFYLEGKNIDLVQGYSVFYVFQVISHMSKLLLQISNKVYMMPDIKEFFPQFMFDSMNKAEIIRKKDWNYLTNRE